MFCISAKINTQQMKQMQLLQQRKQPSLPVQKTGQFTFCGALCLSLTALVSLMTVSAIASQLSWSYTVFKQGEKKFEKNYAHAVLLRLNMVMHRLEKYLNLEGFLEKSLKIKYVLKSTGKYWKISQRP